MREKVHSCSGRNCDGEKGKRESSLVYEVGLVCNQGAPT